MTPGASGHHRSAGGDSKLTDPGGIAGQNMRSRFAVPKEEEALREAFAFLTRDMGFEEVFRRNDEYGSSITWQGENTGVIVTFSEREKVRVQVARLVDDGKGGKTVPVERSGYSTPLARDVFDLREILHLRAPEELESLLKDNLKLKFKEALQENARLLQQYCRDMLEGDFSYFEVLNRNNVAAVQKMRKDAGLPPL